MKVEKTHEYSKFKTMPHNREINPVHVTRLVKSMQDQLLCSPLIVNEKMQICDGQHRFHALQELKKPVQYIVVKGYGDKEVQRYNALQANWANKDFLRHYISKQKPVYLKIAAIMEETGLPLTCVQGICEYPRRVDHSDFKMGVYTIHNKNADRDARLFASLGIKNPQLVVKRRFADAFVKALHTKGVKQARLMKCVDDHGAKIPPNLSCGGYLLQLQQAYNFALKQDQKVRLYIEDL